MTLVGSVFFRWTVIEDLPQRRVLARCSCGIIKSVSISELKRGGSKSCGCYRVEKVGDVHRLHGGSGTKLYHVWRQMIKRCFDPRVKGYKNYGGRGIKVCTDWLEFPSFRVWSLTNGYTEGLTLERLNNEKGYSPDNCAFVPRPVNNRNTRRAVKLVIFGECKNAVDWAKDPRCVVRYSVLTQRLRAGYAPEVALTTRYLPKGPQAKEQLLPQQGFW